MFSVLRNVMLADRCFLRELLYWAAVRRFPLWEEDPRDGSDFRFSRECGLDTSIFTESQVTFAECEYAGISPNPRYRALLENGDVFDRDSLERVENYIDQQLSALSPEEFSEADREELTARRREIRKELNEVDDWDKDFDTYLEYFKSEVFVDLREGRLDGFGAKLKGSSWEDIQKAIDEGDAYPREQVHLRIGQGEWIPSKIDWDKSILYGKEFSYCWVNIHVDQMFSLYPVPDLSTIGSVKKLCDSYILDRQNLDDPPPQPRRGRPPFPWEQFHVEVAALASKNALPEKKEAAIAYFEGWFRDTIGISVSRSAIGQKLKPYYDRFFGTDREKGRG
jgi:hypothetical protein